MEMSFEVAFCGTCKVDCMFERMAPFTAAKEENLYSVAWRCPSCKELALDVCPIGPLVPTENECLNCGGVLEGAPDDPSCRGCGMKRSELLALCRQFPAVDALGQTVKELFMRGLVRRAMVVVNHALAMDRNQPTLWQWKSQMLGRLGYHGAAMRMSEQGLRAGAPAALLLAYVHLLELEKRPLQGLEAIELGLRLLTDKESVGFLLQSKSYFLAEQLQGQEALDAADAATELDPQRSHPHYLRGRALALLGRLMEARGEFSIVLDLDPAHPDAQRAVKMVEEALAGLERKRWWMFWR